MSKTIYLIHEIQNHCIFMGDVQNLLLPWYYVLHVKTNNIIITMIMTLLCWPTNQPISITIALWPKKKQYNTTIKKTKNKTMLFGRCSKCGTGMEPCQNKQHVQITWYYHGTALKTIVLLWYISKTCHGKRPKQWHYHDISEIMTLPRFCTLFMSFTWTFSIKVLLH